MAEKSPVSEIDKEIKTEDSVSLLPAVTEKPMGDDAGDQPAVPTVDKADDSMDAAEAKENEQDKKDDDKNEENVEGKEQSKKADEETQNQTEVKTKGNSEKKRKRVRRKKGKKTQNKEGENKQAGDKPKEKSEEATKLGGVIFMCNAKTKEECFRHRIFGLPSEYTDVVEKIKKGTKLFLYDTNLRLMYGIYVAEGRGRTNINPNAFKSTKKEFPAQVKFRTLRECTPLPENKFREAIKENYFGKGKRRFKLVLSPEQVNKLFKLFKRPHPGINSGASLGGRSRNELSAAVRPIDSVRAIEARPIPLPPSYAHQLELSAREYSGRVPIAAEQFVPAYQRPVLDGPSVRGGLDPLAPPRSALDSELEYLYQKRLRERALEDAYLNDLRRTQPLPRDDYLDRYMVRGDLPSGAAYSSISGTQYAPPGPAASYPPVSGISSSLYRY
eukprot:TRINITY_DN232_c0_g1_i1.p1 TRINITY_DN232_c0_g1~~TRINITY_DN232_c0_g1_i1.p1  ORF type:complete len:443 (+),score=97.65 TRINITY_DN232_c0_g1_i1:202-1530(+)